MLLNQIEATIALRAPKAEEKKPKGFWSWLFFGGDKNENNSRVCSKKIRRERKENVRETNT